ncbi:MAG TPA: asparaginase [Gemmatimonadaceae bacterium]|nr:asparaginase [Gemmatimonadaceae bacterium]
MSLRAVPSTYDLDVVVTRGAAVESRHRVHAAVVDASGALVGSARDPRLVTYWRSCAKPFQVMPLLASGGFDRLKWGDDQLALACASHGGEPEHVAIAEAMLDTIGLEEGDLACGPHEPLSSRGAKLVRESGHRLTRLHNNCSGKHAAMLARARTEGWPTVGYERTGHAVQRDIVAELERWCDVRATDFLQAVDGCGVVVFGLPLYNMALAYARLVAAAKGGEDIPSRVVHAMITRPFLVGGSDRFDSALMEETEGRVLSKVGAEGVHTVALADSGIAFAVKVEDGAQRAQFTSVLRMLQLLGALPEELPSRLAEFAHKPLRNTRGETVGEVRAAS